MSLLILPEDLENADSSSMLYPSLATLTEFKDEPGMIKMLKKQTVENSEEYLKKILIITIFIDF